LSSKRHLLISFVDIRLCGAQANSTRCSHTRVSTKRSRLPFRTLALSQRRGVFCERGLFRVFGERELGSDRRETGLLYPTDELDAAATSFL
jgi:hypothetical protein